METNSKWKMILGSRKFWAAVVGIAFVVIKNYVPGFPITEEQLIGLVVIVVGYIFGTALEDGLSAGKPGAPDPAGVPASGPKGSTQ